MRKRLCSIFLTQQQRCGNCLSSQMKQIFIFTHIPKTAGTSLRYHFQTHLRDQIEFIHLTNKGHKNAVQQGLLPFIQRSLKERNRAKVILGHDVNINTASLVNNKNVTELVYFRDPVSWEISRYNQYANAKSFKNEPYLNYPDWINFEKTRSQFDWFLKNYGLVQSPPSCFKQKYILLTDILKPFKHVGFVDQINDDMIDVFKYLHIPLEMSAENVTGKYKKKDLFSLSHVDLTTVSRNCAKEIELFLKIRKKFDRKFN